MNTLTRRRWIAGVLVLAVVALAAWFFRPGKPAPPQAGVSAPIANAPVPASMPSAAASVPTSASVATDPQALARERRDRLWCELESRPRPSASAPDGEAASTPESPADQLMAEAREDLVQRWSAQLMARGDERSRAMALRLQALGTGPVPGDSQARRQLIALASTTASPEVFVWAHQSCFGDRACEAQLPARQLLRLAPGNRYAMDLVFNEAARDGDVQGQREALYQAGIAPYSDDYNAAAIRMLGSLPVRDEGPESTVVTMLYVRIGFGNLPNFSPTTRYCSKADSGDQADRRALCAKAAQTRASQAQSLLDLGLARALARSAGDAKLATSLTKEFDGLQKGLMDSSESMMEVLVRGDACAAGGILRKRQYEVMTQGEVAFVRARMAAAASAAAR